MAGKCSKLYYSFLLLVSAFLYSCNDIGQQPGNDKNLNAVNCSESRVTGIRSSDVYDLSGYKQIGGGDPFHLFDEADFVDPLKKIGNPSTNPHPTQSPANYFRVDKGSRIVIDLQVPYQLSSIFLYDRSSVSDSIFIYTGTMREWKLQSSYKTTDNSGDWGWKKITVSDLSRFVMIRFSSYESQVTEMVMYGCPDGNPAALTTETNSTELYTEKTLREFVGVNAYQPIDPIWLEPFHSIRLYTFTSAIDKDTINEYPQNRYNLSVHGRYDRSGRNYAFFADSIVNHQKKEIWYSIIGVPKWMENRGYGNHDRPVTIPGMDTDDPESYRRHAEMYWTLAAAFGSQKHDSTSIRSSGRPISGQQLLNVFENGNEPDAFWVGSKYCDPMEYFAMSTAVYDGHEKKLGPKMGLLQADKDARLMMAGFASLDTNRLRVLNFISRNLRTDSLFIWKGGVQYHHYSHNGKGNTQGERWSSATAGITPEEDSLRIKLSKVSRATRRIAPGVECILGEFGYDKNRKSKVSSPIIPGYSIEESQAIMLIRAINAVAFSGFDRLMLYWLKDDFPSDYEGLYLTSGFLYQDKSGAIHPYPSWYYINTMVNYLGDYVPDSILSETGDVWIYRYRHNKQKNRFAYFLYHPGKQGQTTNNYHFELSEAVDTMESVQFDNQSKLGIKRRLKAENGRISLAISEQPILLLPVN